MRAWLILLLAIALSGCEAPTTSSTQRPGSIAATQTANPTDMMRLARDINPLTGLRVADPALLKIPALLVSISHFPPAARPQAGLSFAPFVYEFYITEGATRFLAVFYGEWPKPEAPVSGGCEPRVGPFIKSGMMLGNRVWLDANRNGVQDPGEGGIGGLCVNLYNADSQVVQRAASDSNGFYGFNVTPGRYGLEFDRPDGYAFTKANAGEDSADSDVNPASGRVDVNVSGDDLSVDAGLVPSQAAAIPAPESLPPAQVGPVRSGRLIYRYIAKYFANSCLIYAFASEEVLQRLPQCHMVFHELAGGGYMMDLSEMKAVAQQNLRAKGSDFNYAGNAFDEAPPAGGQPASLLKVYFAYLNQSGWAYDPVSQSYLRYVDTAEYDQAGALHPDTDRLTGRQLSVQNVIVLYAEHDVVSPTNLDIHLDRGASGKAALFRNGQVFDITWSTKGYPADAGQIRPIRFLEADSKPVPLEPGHTWVIVVTPDSQLEQTKPGQWTLTFAQPPGAK